MKRRKQKNKKKKKKTTKIRAVQNVEDLHDERSSEELLDDLKQKYVDVNSPIGYAGAKTIFRYYKRKLPIDRIKIFLSEKDGYTLTKRSRRARYYNKTYCRRLRQNLQLDVFYMTEFAKQNKGIKHILIGVDV